MIELRSKAFSPGAPIPRRHTGEGEDLSPPLEWSELPEGTVELVLICDDPDAPSAKPFLHWLLYRLPASVTGLAEGDDGGGIAGANDFGSYGYRGPMPPKGHGTHHYRFRLYALDTALRFPAGAHRGPVEVAMGGHVLDRGELIGIYER